MLIGYLMPPISGVTLTGAGAAWLTADGHAALFDGKPARRARLQWLNDATPATTQSVKLTVAFVAAFTPRLVALLGLANVPAGVLVQLHGAGGAGLGGNTQTQRTVQFADGSVGIWLVTDGLQAISSLEVSIFNDQHGATWATSETTIDIGELVAMPAVDVEIEPGWQEEVVDPTETNLTRAAQVVSSRRQAYRRLEASLTADSGAQVRAGGLAGGVDWQRLRAAFVGDQRMAAVPRWLLAGGSVDGAEANRTAVYGVARMGAMSHLGGDFYGASMSVQEVPGLA
jgi:hypothetical protein